MRNAAQEETSADYDAWASYYELTDADRSSHIEFYTGLLTGGTRSVLELGCGTGTVLRQVALRLKTLGIAPPRCVGVDLSDGMFWGALGLKDNSWVTVEYLWTAAGKD